MKIAIIINAKRFSDELAAKLESKELANKYNLSYDLFVKEPNEIETLLTTLNPKTYNAYIVGGGDGTVATVVPHLFEQNIPLAILPLGTFNLLAKSLEHPNDIDALLAMVKNNKTKQIDIAEVNKEMIINHAWIGFYYHLLKEREKHKDILGKSKLLKIIFNTMNLFKRLPFYTLTVHANNEICKYKTCLIFIGNNESYTNFFEFGEHKYLSSGLLSVSILNCKTRWQLFICMLTVLLGKFRDSKYITTFTTDNLTITTTSEVIKTVIDGELYKLRSPLNFKLHPKKLMVITP